MNDPLTELTHNPIPETIQKARSKKSKLVSKIVTWSLVTLVVAFLIFLNFYFKNLYMELYELTKRVIEDRSFMTYFNIFLLNLLLQMCFVPGISFFIMFIGFICKDYFYALSLIIPSTLVVCTLTYFLTRFTIKLYLEKKLSGEWYYEMFHGESASKPWQTSFMLRFILIPVTYKNYLISLMDINFLQFIVPCVLFYIPYFSNYLLIGKTISSIKDIIDGKFSEAELEVVIMFICVHVVLILISIVSLGYLIYKTCQLHKKYKEEKLKEKLVANEAETN